MAYQSFEELEIWKRACRLAVDVTKTLETTRNFALRDQMIRAAISIPSNIAEGHERDSRLDFIRFLRIAKRLRRRTAHSMLFGKQTRRSGQNYG